MAAAIIVRNYAAARKSFGFHLVFLELDSFLESSASLVTGSTHTGHKVLNVDNAALYR